MYKIQVTRQVMKDLSSLPEDYAQAISQHIDDLAEKRIANCVVLISRNDRPCGCSGDFVLTGGQRGRPFRPFS